jgi:hypothetical protein
MTLWDYVLFEDTGQVFEGIIHPVRARLYEACGALLCLDARQRPAHGEAVGSKPYEVRAVRGKLANAAVGGQKIPQYTEGDFTWMWPWDESTGTNSYYPEFVLSSSKFVVFYDMFGGTL